jgi:hypothetical protein
MVNCSSVQIRMTTIAIPCNEHCIRHERFSESMARARTRHALSTLAPSANRPDHSALCGKEASRTRWHARACMGGAIPDSMHQIRTAWAYEFPLNTTAHKQIVRRRRRNTTSHRKRRGSASVQAHCDSK